MILRIIVIFLVLFNLAFAPAVVSKIREGNKLFTEQKYDEALSKYTDAQIERPESPELFFNIADTLYQQRKYADAEQMLVKAIPHAEPQLEAKIYYNIGNCKYRQGQLRESLDYYKQALELNPDDEDAKYNIEFVERKIKEMLSQAQKRQEEQQQDQQQEQEGQQQQEQQQQEKQQQEQQQQGQQQQGEEGEQKEEEKPAARAEEGKEEDRPEEKEQEQKAAGEQEKEHEKPQAEQQEESADEEQPLPSPEELTKEEAEALLRMIADEERSGERPEEKKRRPARYRETEKLW